MTSHLHKCTILTSLHLQNKHFRRAARLRTKCLFFSIRHCSDFYLFSISIFDAIAVVVVAVVVVVVLAAVVVVVVAAVVIVVVVVVLLLLLLLLLLFCCCCCVVVVAAAAVVLLANTWNY